MYFWKDRELAKRLHENAVPQKEQMRYFLIYTVLITIMMSATANFHAWHAAEPLSIFDYATDIIILSVGIASVLICYRMNSLGDNADFIARWMCLSFPISIRMLAFMLCLGIGSGLAMGVYDVFTTSPEELETMMEAEWSQTEFSTAEEILWFFVVNIPIVYWLQRIHTSFKIASGQV